MRELLNSDAPWPRGEGELTGSASWKSCCRKRTFSPLLPGVTCTWECGKKRLKHWKKDTECGILISFTGSLFMRSSTRCAPSPVFKKCSTGLASCEKSLDLRGCCLFALFASCNCTSSERANNRRSHRPKRRDRSSCRRACQQFGYGIRGRFCKQRRWNLHGLRVACGLIPDPSRDDGI